VEQYNALISTIAMTVGVGWASGLNLYATMLVLGLGAANGLVSLPPGLEILANPLVIGAAGLMYAIEFFTDKVPGVDTVWDSVHTFIRIPAGALLAAGAAGDVAPGLTIAAAILGGGVAATTHATKAGTRVLINTSPEPFTNWGASLAEDAAVVAGLWTALEHPYVFLGLFVVFIVFIVWFLPKLWRGIKGVFRALGRLFGRQPATAEGRMPASNVEELSHGDKR
jgi:hypothetical protein